MFKAVGITTMPPRFTAAGTWNNVGLTYEVGRWLKPTRGTANGL